ncbi:MAG TPA: protoporphyrinogen oxidase HemJ [Rhodospirillaceae bacterium]|nr:protoporphyrinogen oxidase HemJ [Rhodospirillaceae bacterium]
MSEFYLWLKALHVIAVISWMAGLLYLPRLFVYHTQVAAASEQSALFKVMERRLMQAIMTPAAMVTWLVGLWMTGEIGLADNHWLHAKLTLVAAMTVMHVLMERWRRDFAADRNRRPTRFFRIANEVPTLLMIAIVVLVVVKPF